MILDYRVRGEETFTIFFEIDTSSLRFVSRVTRPLTLNRLNLTHSNPFLPLTDCG
jgi:hypothetical protein